MSSDQAETSRTVGSDGKDSPPPDSWELADVDFRLQDMNLKPSHSSSSGDAASSVSTRKHAKPTSAWDEKPLEGVLAQADEGILLGPIRSLSVQENQCLTAKDFMVDSFLFEALQNPRDRLAVLRMEQEVLKFLKDPQQLLMEFPPMPTSYHRAAAHRVAQHYFLVTTAVETGEMTTVVARKPAIGGPVSYPPYKLVDIPVKARSENEGPSPDAAAGPATGMTAAQLKRAIMQRPKDERRAGAGEAGGSASSQAQTMASVEKRQEEYNKARARIFNSSASSLSSSSSTEGPADSSGALIGQGSANQPGLSPSSSTSSLVSPGAGLVPGLEKSNSGKKKGKGKAAGKPGMGDEGEEKGAEGGQNGGGRKGKHVAILRDKEKERLDPDYRRGAERFGQRFDPGFGVMSDPVPAPYIPGHQPLYAPAATYNTEFPSLGTATSGHQTGSANISHHSGPMLQSGSQFHPSGGVGQPAAVAQRGGATAGPHSAYGQPAAHNAGGHIQGRSPGPSMQGQHVGSIGHPQQAHATVPMPWAVPGVMGQGFPVGVSSPAPHAEGLHYGMGPVGVYGVSQGGLPAFSMYSMPSGAYFQGGIPTQHYSQDQLRHGPYLSVHPQQSQQLSKPGLQGNNVRQQKP